MSDLAVTGLVVYLLGVALVGWLMWPMPDEGPADRIGYDLIALIAFTWPVSVPTLVVLCLMVG